MLGIRSVFRVRVKAVNHDTKHIHSMIHRYALACKTLPSELRAILDDVFYMVKFHQFKRSQYSSLPIIMPKIYDEQNTLLFHTEVRWFLTETCLECILCEKRWQNSLSATNESNQELFWQIKLWLLDSLT